MASPAPIVPAALSAQPSPTVGMSPLPQAFAMAVQSVHDLELLAQVHQADLDNHLLLTRAAQALRTLFPRMDTPAAQDLVNEHGETIERLLQGELARDIQRLSTALIALGDFQPASPQYDSKRAAEWRSLINHVSGHPLVNHRAPYARDMLKPWASHFSPPRSHAAATPNRPILHNPVAAGPTDATTKRFFSTLGGGGLDSQDALLAALAEEREAIERQQEADEFDQEENENEDEDEDDDEDEVSGDEEEVVVPPGGYTLTPVKLASLNPELDAFYAARRLSPEELHGRHGLLLRLNDLIAAVDPGLGVVVFGSSASGTASKGSDMDCAVVTRTGGAPQANMKALMKRIVAVLHRRSGQYAHIQPIFHARVPILKFVCRSSAVAVDLALGQPSTAPKSALMAGYGIADPRFVPLLSLVKAWASAHDLNDASRNTLNSFGYSLMVIQYLQILQPRILTTLQQPSPTTSAVASAAGELSLTLADPQLPSFLSLAPEQRFFVRQSKDSASTSTLTLGELLAGFFDFFGHRFDASRMAVCIRTGSLVDKAPCRTHILAQNPKARTVLLLVDPFDPADNVARGITQDVWKRIQAAMRRAAAGLVATGRFDAILVLDPEENLKKLRQDRKKEKKKEQRKLQKKMERNERQRQQRHLQQQQQQQQQPRRLQVFRQPQHHPPPPTPQQHHQPQQQQQQQAPRRPPQPRSFKQQMQHAAAAAEPQAPKQRPDFDGQPKPRA